MYEEDYVSSKESDGPILSEVVAAPSQFNREVLLQGNIMVSEARMGRNS